MRIPTWLFITGILGMMAAAMLLAVPAFLLARDFAMQTRLAGIEVAAPAESLRRRPTPVPTLVSQATSRPNVVAADTAPETPPPSLDDPRARNILLLGIDQRSGIFDNERYYRSDTMIVARLEPLRQRMGMLSIPRDLWLEFADGGPPARINTANSRGDSQGYPTGGPGLAADTLQHSFGLRIDNFLLINFDAFLRAVELLAPQGVELCIDDRIVDRHYPNNGYGTITIVFEAGCQRLDAERLLQYARTRATPGADFDRARRQQQVLGALLRHLASLEGIGRLVAQAPALWQELGGSFRTDLTLEEILQFASLLRTIPPENLRHEVIDTRVVEFATAPGGERVLYPDYAAVRALIQEVLVSG